MIHIRVAIVWMCVSLRCLSVIQSELSFVYVCVAHVYYLITDTNAWFHLNELALCLSLFELTHNNIVYPISSKNDLN